MKKHILLIVLSLITFVLTAQWIQQNSGTNEYLNSVCFTDTLNGWVVGNNGIILHTDNGGINWDIQTSSTDEILTDVCFADSVHGWISGYKPYGYIDVSFVYRTLDGGDNWEQIDLGFCAPDEIYFTDTLNGWTSSGIFHTGDGGEAWEVQFDESWDTGGVYFTDSLNGWVVGSTYYGSTGTIDGTILHTNDGGNTWDYQYDHYPSATLNSVYFTDSLKGWVVGGGYGLILKTTDGGNNWDTVYHNSPGILYSICFADAFNGWAVGYNGSIVSTTDGGNTWESESSGTSTHLSKVCFTENGFGWIVGENGTILHADYSQVVGQDEHEARGQDIEVDCYPNPSNGISDIKYQISIGYRQLAISKKVELGIYDIRGQKIKTLVNEMQLPGEYTIRFDGSELPAGIYFIRMQAGDKVVTEKLVMM